MSPRGKPAGRAATACIQHEGLGPGFFDTRQAGIVADKHVMAAEFRDIGDIVLSVASQAAPCGKELLGQGGEMRQGAAGDSIQKRRTNKAAELPR